MQNHAVTAHSPSLLRTAGQSATERERGSQACKTQNTGAAPSRPSICLDTVPNAPDRTHPACRTERPSGPGRLPFSPPFPSSLTSNYEAMRFFPKYRVASGIPYGSHNRTAVRFQVYERRLNSRERDTIPCGRFGKVGSRPCALASQQSGV